MAELNERGHEILDPKPMALPVGLNRPPTLNERIKQLIRGEISRRAEAQGEETFEEADDFEVGDDFDPKSPYEQNFDQDQNIENLKTSMQEQKALIRKQKQKPETEQIEDSRAGKDDKSKKGPKRPPVEESETDEEDNA